MPEDFRLLRPDGTPITRWEDWSPPKKEKIHWKPGRSAMELAKAWFPDGRLSPPCELMALLSTHRRFAGLRLVHGIPEHVTPLPVRGEGRNHDLWLLGKTPSECVTVCVEAKADEPFGNEAVAKYRESALARREKGIPTGVPDRIDALLGIVGQPLAAWAGVRYQLLAAVCGTILQARADGSGCGVFVVHVFRTALTTPENLARNDADYEAMLATLGIPQAARADGVLLGPMSVGGADCFFGKVTKRT